MSVTSLSERSDTSYASPPNTGSPTSGPAEQTFSHILEQLFTTIRDANEKAYSAKDIVQRSAAAGYPMTESYLSQLRRGRVQSPSLNCVVGLSLAFGVDIHVFCQSTQHTTTPSVSWQQKIEKSAEILAEILDGIQGNNTVLGFINPR